MERKNYWSIKIRRMKMGNPTHQDLRKKRNQTHQLTEKNLGKVGCFILKSQGSVGKQEKIFQDGFMK